MNRNLDWTTRALEVVGVFTASAGLVCVAVVTTSCALDGDYSQHTAAMLAAICDREKVVIATGLGMAALGGLIRALAR